MNWTDLLFSTIDPRSFSNLWFWLVLAVAWSNTTHFIMGVPFDMVQRARRLSGEAGEDAMLDLETLTAIQARRRIQILASSGPWLVGFWMMVLTMLVLLGFRYGVELAQALSLLLAPLTLASWLGMRLAVRVDAGMGDGSLRGEALADRLFWHRITLQAIGLLTIFVTTLWGMWQNLALRVLG